MPISALDFLHSGLCRIGANGAGTPVHGSEVSLQIWRHAASTEASGRTTTNSAPIQGKGRFEIEVPQTVLNGLAGHGQSDPRTSLPWW